MSQTRFKIWFAKERMDFANIAIRVSGGSMCSSRLITSYRSPKVEQTMAKIWLWPVFAVTAASRITQLVLIQIQAWIACSLIHNKTYGPITSSGRPIVSFILQLKPIDLSLRQLDLTGIQIRRKFGRVLRPGEREDVQRLAHDIGHGHLRDGQALFFA